MTGIKQFLDERRSCISYYISCPATETCAMIDPCDQVEKYIKQADAELVRITHVIDTHILLTTFPELERFPSLPARQFTCTRPLT